MVIIMEEVPIISCILPVYNVDKYIGRCIETILSQTFSNFELIIIDDGSTDKSGSICESYALKDKRIKIIHKTNGGVSSARNLGICFARGIWISFIDSDDWVESCFFERMLDASYNSNADIIQCNYFHNDKEKKSEPDITNLKQSDLFFLMCKDEMHSYIWNKFFKAEIIKSYRFDEQLKICEDLEFFLRVLQSVENCKAINDYLYHYNTENDGSALHSFNIKKIHEIINTFNIILASKFANIDVTKGYKEIIYRLVCFKMIALKYTCDFNLYGLTTSEKEVAEEKISSFSKKDILFIKWIIQDKILPVKVYCLFIKIKNTLRGFRNE